MSEFERFVAEGEDSFRIRVPVGESFMLADVLLSHVEGMVGRVRSEPRARRRFVLKSVEKALRRITAKVDRGESITESERADAADDAAIWWLYEYVAGRGERYVVAKDPVELVPMTTGGPEALSQEEADAATDRIMDELNVCLRRWQEERVRPEIILGSTITFLAAFTIGGPEPDKLVEVVVERFRQSCREILAEMHAMDDKESMH